MRVSKCYFHPFDFASELSKIHKRKRYSNTFTFQFTFEVSTAPLHSTMIDYDSNVDGISNIIPNGINVESDNEEVYFRIYFATFLFFFLNI